MAAAVEQPFDADQDRRDEAEEMSWLQLSFYFGRESAVQDGGAFNMRRYLSGRRRALQADGRCVDCKARTRINPATGKPYARCEAHREEARSYMVSHRRAA